MNIDEIQVILQNLTNAKITQSDIARALDKDRGNINAKAKRGTELKLSELRKIEDYFNVELVNKDLNTTISQQNNNGEESFLDIPVRGDIQASMGLGVTVYNESQTGVYKISPQLLRDIGASQSSTEMIFAKGDSMLPTIEGGDSLLIDLSKREVYDGSIYCVRIDGQLYAKRLQKIPPSIIKVISDNKEKYDPIYIDFSKDIDFDFKVIGEVRWWGRIAK